MNAKRYDCSYFYAFVLFTTGNSQFAKKKKTLPDLFLLSCIKNVFKFGPPKLHLIFINFTPFFVFTRGSCQNYVKFSGKQMLPAFNVRDGQFPIPTDQFA